MLWVKKSQNYLRIKKSCLKVCTASNHSFRLYGWNEAFFVQWARLKKKINNFRDKALFERPIWLGKEALDYKLGPSCSRKKTLCFAISLFMLFIILYWLNAGIKRFLQKILKKKNR